MPFKKKLGHILSYLLQIVILTIFFFFWKIYLSLLTEP